MSGLELTLAAALLAPAQAQTQTISSARMVSTTATARRPVDEQIEVMRALLLRKLAREPATYYWNYPKVQDYVSPKSGEVALESANQGAAYTNALYGAYRPGGSHGSAVEGVYLDGYGAVFTATMDAVARDPRPKADGDKPPAAVSDWDRAQKALRGEPVPERPAAAAKDPPLGDVLLKLLADNGKHFTALKDDERLMVVVTFRRTGYTAPVLTTGQNALTGTAVYGQSSTTEPKEDRLSTMTSLGDLHLKQGQPDRAIEAYAKALSIAESNAKESPDSKEDRDRVQSALTKLAQAYLAAGKVDEAREAMEKAKSAREPKGGSGGRTANKAGGVGLPARLTVSAPKKLLDQVGSGAITFDEFRKQAAVEYVAAAK